MSTLVSGKVVDTKDEIRIRLDSASTERLCRVYPELAGRPIIAVVSKSQAHNVFHYDEVEFAIDRLTVEDGYEQDGAAPRAYQVQAPYAFASCDVPRGITVTKHWEMPTVEPLIV